MKRYYKVLFNGLIAGLFLVVLIAVACQQNNLQHEKDLEIKPYDPYAFDALTEDELKADTGTLLLRVANSKYLMQWIFASAQSNPQPQGTELKEYNGYQELLKREDFLDVVKEYEKDLITHKYGDVEGRKRNLKWLMAQNEVKELLKESDSK